MILDCRGQAGDASGESEVLGSVGFGGSLGSLAEAHVQEKPELELDGGVKPLVSLCHLLPQFPQAAVTSELDTGARPQATRVHAPTPALSVTCGDPGWCGRDERALWGQGPGRGLWGREGLASSSTSVTECVALGSHSLSPALLFCASRERTTKPVLLASQIQ